MFYLFVKKKFFGFGDFVKLINFTWISICALNDCKILPCFSLKSSVSVGAFFFSGKSLSPRRLHGSPLPFLPRGVRAP